MEPPREAANFEVFRDFLTPPLIEKFNAGASVAPKKRKVRTRRKRSQVDLESINTTPEDSANNAEGLEDFINYISMEIFTALPKDFRDLTYFKYRDKASFQTQFPVPLPPATSVSILKSFSPSVADTLNTYVLPPSSTIPLITPAELLHPVLAAYLQHITTPPPPPSSTKCLAEGCEICAREHLNLTYHHLIPRSVHGKIIKRAWHDKDELNNVAWLCRACHSFIRRLASNEELARNLYTVEKLLEREETQKWRTWISGIRWKKS